MIAERYPRLARYGQEFYGKSADNDREVSFILSECLHMVTHPSNDPNIGSHSSELSYIKAAGLRFLNEVAQIIGMEPLDRRESGALHTAVINGFDCYVVAKGTLAVFVFDLAKAWERAVQDAREGKKAERLRRWSQGTLSRGKKSKRARRTAKR